MLSKEFLKRVSKSSICVICDLHANQTILFDRTGEKWQINVSLKKNDTSKFIQNHKVHQKAQPQFGSSEHVLHK